MTYLHEELNEVEKRELAHHEEIYRTAQSHSVDLALDPSTFLKNLDQDAGPGSDVNRLAIDLLGDLKGKTILDYGCGDGRFAVCFALLGAEQVYGFDLSLGAIELAQERARQNGVDGITHFQPMSAHALTYPDQAFDLIFGNLVMHHIPIDRLETCGRQVHRVLKMNGKAVFVEPLGENPLLEFIRTHPFYDKSYASPDERTITYRDIQTFGSAFQHIRCHERHLLLMLKRVIHRPGVLDALRKLDDGLLRAAPVLKKYCGEVAIEYAKAGDNQ